MRYLRSFCVLRVYQSEFSFLIQILAKLNENKLFDQDNAKECAKITNFYSERTRNARTHLRSFFFFTVTRLFLIKNVRY
jgi:hypothetical protein